MSRAARLRCGMVHKTSELRSHIPLCLGAQATAQSGSRPHIHQLAMVTHSPYVTSTPGFHTVRDATFNPWPLLPLSSCTNLSKTVCATIMVLIPDVGGFCAGFSATYHNFSNSMDAASDATSSAPWDQHFQRALIAPRAQLGMHNSCRMRFCAYSCCTRVRM
eukprot:COSAG02_NODE_2253_length_9348_cov_21.784842_2_plen_162_part_00